MLVPLLQGISLAVVPLLSVGPFKVYVLSMALSQGWRRALPLATVPLVADIPVIVLIWTTVTQLPAWTVDGLRTMGGFVYLYLAVGLIRTARTKLSGEVLDPEVKRSYRQAVLAVWVTPAVYINWSVIGVPAMIAYAEQSLAHLVLFLAGFYVLWVGGLAVQIFLVSQAGRLWERGTEYLVYAGGLLLVGFGIYQIWTGTAGLLGLL